MSKDFGKAIVSSVSWHIGGVIKWRILESSQAMHFQLGSRWSRGTPMILGNPNSWDTSADAAHLILGDAIGVDDFLPTLPIQRSECAMMWAKKDEAWGRGWFSNKLETSQLSLSILCSLQLTPYSTHFHVAVGWGLLNLLNLLVVVVREVPPHNAYLFTAHRLHLREKYYGWYHITTYHSNKKGQEEKTNLSKS